MAAEADPRAYGNAPDGLNVLQVLYSHSKKRGHYDLTTDAEVLYYYRYVDFFGNAAVIGGFVPFVDAHLSAPALRFSTRSTGMGDPTLLIGTDLVGAPSLSREEFRHYHQNTIVGISLQITAPLGKYDPASTLNVGSNRWTFKPEIALSQALGKFVFDLYGNYYSYTDNKDYSSGLLKKQDGLWGIDTHLSYTLARGAWISADYFRTWGGETIINGVRQNNAVRDSTLGTTLKLPLSSSLSIKAKYRRSIKTRSGDKARTFRMKLQYLW